MGHVVKDAVTGRQVYDGAEITRHVGDSAVNMGHVNEDAVTAS